MRKLVCFLAAVSALCPQWAAAEMLPHRAEYALRLGPAANAPRVGTAIQDLTQDCGGWHLKRDINTEIAITPSWKMTVVSKLDSDELRSGNGLRYRTLQIQNGNERETRGKVQRAGKELRAEIVSPNGPKQFALPPPTLMPVAAIGHLIERLRRRRGVVPRARLRRRGDQRCLPDRRHRDRSRRAARSATGRPDGHRTWPVVAGVHDLHTRP